MPPRDAPRLARAAGRGAGAGGGAREQKQTVFGTLEAEGEQERIGEGGEEEPER